VFIINNRTGKVHICNIRRHFLLQLLIKNVIFYLLGIYEQFLARVCCYGVWFSKLCSLDSYSACQQVSVFIKKIVASFRPLFCIKLRYRTYFCYMT
jgi:hypothetical protein